MAEMLVGKLSDFEGDARLIVAFGDTEVGVFRRNGNLYAYENFCLHQGGPACEGTVIERFANRVARMRRCRAWKSIRRISG